MSEIKRKIDRIIEIGPKPMLKTTGFRKSGRTWFRETGESVQVVNVQASQVNMGGEGRFYINLGVYLPELARFTGSEPIAKPKEYECHIIDRLLPTNPVFQTGGAWEILATSDLDGLARDVQLSLEERGLPWLAARSSVREIVEAEIPASPWVMISLHSICGRGESAWQIIEYEMRGSRKALRRRWREYAERIGKIAEYDALEQELRETDAG